MKSKAAFLDRDGTINEAIVKNGKPYPPASLETFKFIPGVSEAISILKNLGYIPVVITNQPDVARGITTVSSIDIIHRIVREKLNIEYIYTCLHDDKNKCNCRKPKPGLILQASQDLGIDLSTSILVGDRWKDIQAGQLVDIKCFFIDYAYNEPRPKPPFKTVSSLLEVAHKLRIDNGF